MAPSDEKSTFAVEDLPTRSTVMLSSKGSEGLAAMETVLGVLIPHPEFFTQKPAAQLIDRPRLSRGCGAQIRSCFDCEDSR